MDFARLVREEKGSTWVLVIICTTATILLAGALLSVAWAELKVTQWQGDNLVQLGIAEAGIEHAHRLLLNDFRFATAPDSPIIGHLEEGYYSVTVEDIGRDQRLITSTAYMEGRPELTLTAVSEINPIYNRAVVCNELHLIRQEIKGDIHVNNRLRLERRCYVRKTESNNFHSGVFTHGSPDGTFVFEPRKYIFGQQSKLEVEGDPHWPGYVYYEGITFDDAIYDGRVTWNEEKYNEIRNYLVNIVENGIDNPKVRTWRIVANNTPYTLTNRSIPADDGDYIDIIHVSFAQGNGKLRLRNYRLLSLFPEDFDWKNVILVVDGDVALCPQEFGDMRFENAIIVARNIDYGYGGLSVIFEGTYLRVRGIMIARDDIHLHHHWTALGWIFPPEFYLRGSLVANRVYLQKANVEYQPEWFQGNERDGQYNFGGNGFLIPFLYDYKVRLRYEGPSQGPLQGFRNQD